MRSERLNRVVLVSVAVAVRCISGCDGLLGMIRLAVFFFAKIPPCLTHSLTRTYIYLFLQFNIEKNLMERS